MSRRPSYGARRSGGGLMPRVIMVLILIGGLVLAVRGAFRAGPAPELDIVCKSKAIGARTPVTVTVGEPKRGLTGVKIEFIQGGKTETLASKSYEPVSPWAFWGSSTPSDSFRFEVGRD